METFNLNPVNSRKSFYGKCRVEVENNVATLISYTTKVASYDMLNNKMVVNGYYSPTTATHINSFLSYYGFEVCNKKQLESYN